MLETLNPPIVAYCREHSTQRNTGSQSTEFLNLSLIRIKGWPLHHQLCRPCSCGPKSS